MNSKKQSERLGEEMTLISADTPFAVTEAYKTLRTNLLFAMAGRPKAEGNNIVVISSALPGEGKSTTCANLAISMAEKSERVLIIDGDMRKPVQNKLFLIPNDHGLSNVLIGEDTLDAALVKNTRPMLDLLPSGMIPPNPIELLSSDAMRGLLGTLCRLYDYIFIDTPPLDIVADALVASENTAGILLVVRPDVCTHENLQATVESVKLAKSNILGVVMSNIKSDEFPYRYRRSYNKYYKKY